MIGTDLCSEKHCCWPDVTVYRFNWFLIWTSFNVILWSKGHEELEHILYNPGRYLVVYIHQKWMGFSRSEAALQSKTVIHCGQFRGSLWMWIIRILKVDNTIDTNYYKVFHYSMKTHEETLIFMYFLELTLFPSAFRNFSIWIFKAALYK